MPAIKTNLIPTVAPGDLLTTLANMNGSLPVRWFTATDPVFFEVLNRPIADIAVRQLVLAKAIDSLEHSVGHGILFPFLIQPQVDGGSEAVDVPIGWIWDMQLSVPKKWENLRLAKIKRISGQNSGTDAYTGKLRLIFTAVQHGSVTETALLYADFDLSITRTYQVVKAAVVPATEEATAIDSGESETVSGYVYFKKLDFDDIIVQRFLSTVAPPANTTDSNGDGLFDHPAIYETSDAVPGNASGDYSATSVNHGTGLLSASAWSVIPSLDSDIQAWLNAFNFPFDANANRTSSAGIRIPLALFREFNITAPAGDQPNGDISGLTYPVWISRIERLNSTSTDLRFFFATHNVTDSSPSTEAVEFATLDLASDLRPGDIVDIQPLSNLQLQTGADAAAWQQHFGRGHVVLSNVWDGTTTTISDFFSAFSTIVDSPADTVFALTSTRIGSFGISRVPKYTPTAGQAAAMKGSTSRRNTPVAPSTDNRFVTELDQGAGNTVDLESVSGISPHAAIERYGYAGSLCHKSVILIVDNSKTNGDQAFYEDQILPRLRALLGRNPVHGDEWFDGTRFKRYVEATSIWVG